VRGPPPGPSGPALDRRHAPPSRMSATENPHAPALLHHPGTVRHRILAPLPRPRRWIPVASLGPWLLVERINLDREPAEGERGTPQKENGDARVIMAFLRNFYNRLFPNYEDQWEAMNQQTLEVLTAVEERAHKK